jgi:hypothetical protein
MPGRFEELMVKVRELTTRRRGRAPRSHGLARRLGDPFEGMRESGLFSGLRHRVRPWQAVPALLAALALIVGGFWLGGVIGGHASAATLVRTLTGKVITKSGIRYVKTPATTVKVNGKTIHIPARTVALPASTVISGTTVAIPINKTVPVTIVTTIPTTVNHTTTTTVVQTLTVTGPTTTVQGPTQTVTDTVTITLPGTTVTLPATS